MAVFTRTIDGSRVVARKVTGTNLPDLSQWLHSIGFPLFAVTEDMTGMVIVADGEFPRVITAAEFAAEFDIPEHLAEEYGAPGD